MPFTPPVAAHMSGRDLSQNHMSSGFLVVEPSKIIFLINIIPQKEDMILLYTGYHSIPNNILLEW